MTGCSKIYLMLLIKDLVAKERLSDDLWNNNTKAVDIFYSLPATTEVYQIKKWKFKVKDIKSNVVYCVGFNEHNRPAVIYGIPANSLRKVKQQIISVNCDDIWNSSYSQYLLWWRSADKE